MKFLLLVIELIKNTICIVHTNFDLISVPLSSKLFSPFISYAGVGIYSPISSYAGVQYNFRTAKFWESISDYLINCVYVDFAHGLYSIDAIRPTYTKKRSKEEKHGF